MLSFSSSVTFSCAISLFSVLLLSFRLSIPNSSAFSLISFPLLKFISSSFSSLMTSFSDS